MNVGDYVGRVLRSEAHQGCHLSVIEHARSRVLPNHAHDWPFVCVLLKGSYVSRTRSSEMEIDNDVAVYHPRAFQHCDAIGRHGGLFFGVQIDPVLLSDSEFGRRGATGDIVAVHDDAPYLILGSLFCALLAGADKLAFESLAAELAGELFAPKACARGAAPRWLTRVEDRLQEGTCISLEDLSREAGVHATTLTRQFRAHKRCSIGDYHARVRAKRAFIGVVSETATLTEVSLMAGYADQSHMTREFKRAFGRTPGEIRRHVRNYGFQDDRALD